MMFKQSIKKNIKESIKNPKILSLIHFNFDSKRFFKRPVENREERESMHERLKRETVPWKELFPDSTYV